MTRSYSDIATEALKLKLGYSWAFGRYQDGIGIILSEEEAVGIQISINSLFKGSGEVRVLVMDFRPDGPAGVPRSHEVVVKDRLPTPIQGKVWITLFGIKVVVV